MSPLAAALWTSLHVATLLAALFVDWWALWFTLGRSFSKTTLLAAGANGASLTAAWLLLASGALGDGSGAARGSMLAWTGAWSAGWVGQTFVECWLVQVWMRRQRSSWRWNRYDLAVLCASNAAVLLAALLIDWRDLRA